MLEKLLRVLHSIDTVYVLMRRKESQSVDQRLEQLLKGRVFTFHPHHSWQKKKVVAVDGDIAKPNLGLDPATIQKLCDQVHVVYHVAASVKFDAEFR
jgi:thioester reductase-like protein